MTHSSRLALLGTDPSRRQVARALILDAYDRMRSESAPWMTPARLIPLIRRHEYPWGERKHWPYKSWLGACRDVLAFLEHRPMPKAARRHLRSLNPLDQLEFEFDDRSQNNLARGGLTDAGLGKQTGL